MLLVLSVEGDSLLKDRCVLVSVCLVNTKFSERRKTYTSGGCIPTESQNYLMKKFGVIPHLFIKCFLPFWVEGNVRLVLIKTTLLLLSMRSKATVPLLNIFATRQAVIGYRAPSVTLTDLCGAKQNALSTRVNMMCLI